MTFGRVMIFVLLAVILGVPFALRPRGEGGRAQADEQVLVVITPHVPQIQQEFARGFDRWHRRVHGSPARIDWRQPGGTAEILKLLEAHFQATAKAGAFDFGDPASPRTPAGSTAYDVMLGGGSYEHGRLRAGAKVVVDGVERVIPMSEPAGFEQAQLDAWYGENKVGSQPLYDAQQYWLGTALSGFGIVYNREQFEKLGMPLPERFGDLADPRLMGMLTFADPRQSGSVTTTLDAILSREGWDSGWRLLRELSANTRYFTNSAPKPPIDVSHGEAAAGLAIDFYGRGQAQAVVLPGQDPLTSRVGYVDPKGEAYIDADPVSVLRGGPNPALARRFVEYLLTEEAQALWQFRSTRGAGEKNPVGADGNPMGPLTHELRRMPVRRVMYEKYAGAMIDRVNPFELASDASPAGWRSAIPIMMGAFAIDTAHDLREAWAALHEARASGEFSAETLARLEAQFHAFPATRVSEARVLEFTRENYKEISAAWKDPAVRARLEIEYTTFFRENYRAIVRDVRRGRSGRSGLRVSRRGIGPIFSVTWRPQQNRGMV